LKARNPENSENPCPELWRGVSVSRSDGAKASITRVRLASGQGQTAIQASARYGRIGRFGAGTHALAGVHEFVRQPGGLVDTRRVGPPHATGTVQRDKTENMDTIGTAGAALPTQPAANRD